MPAMWLLEQWVDWSVIHSGFTDVLAEMSLRVTMSHAFNQMLHQLDMCVHLSDFVSNFYLFSNLKFVFIVYFSF